MADITGKQLLHRYTLKISKSAEGAEQVEAPIMEVVASFYRGAVDAGYREMVKNMIDVGLFDEFLAAVLQGLVHQGKFGSALC